VKRLVSAWVLGSLAMLCLWLPVGASAQLRFAPGDVSIEMLNSAGQPETRAGAHPDRFLIGFKTSDDGGAPEKLKDVVIGLPEGFAGNLSTVPACSREVFAETKYGGGYCDETKSAVGKVLDVNMFGPEIFNLEPAPNEAGAFAQGILFPLKFPLTPDVDGSLEMRLTNLPELDNQGSANSEFEFELWGVPADHQATAIPRAPFLSNPTRCDGAPAITVSARTWQHPERWFSGTANTGHPQTGCASLLFGPATDFALSDPRADAPSGADIKITVPQNEDPDGQAASQVKSANVVLPAGMTLSPGAAEGLVACSDAELAAESSAEAQCPGRSRVGSVQVTASALGKDPLEGKVYLGQEHPGERLRFFVVIQGRGFQMKFIGQMDADPKTGQLTTSLNDLPQVAFNAMTLHFDGGPDALLATPLTCGSTKSNATFTPYSGSAPVQSTATVSIAASGGGACSGQPPFSPSFSAGSTNNGAGKPTAFRSLLTRKDGEALPARTEIAFPAGMSATLGQVGKCAEADAAKGTCPPSSQIGKALAELGPGPNPAQVKGQIFLTGPYRGQPFGLALAFGGKLGPLDLGTLVVRGSLRFDAQSGELSAVIDSLPRLFEGIAVRFGALEMRIDRPGFLSNPTSCAPSSILATTGSQTGQVSRTEVPFKVNGCIELPFKPTFGLALNGRSQLKQGGKPGLSVSLGLPTNGANMRSADISLPGPLRFDSSAPREICARRKATEGRCSERSRVGSASAKTPMLNEPLKGGVYLAQPKGGGQPDVWTHLQGGGLTLDMQSNTLSKDGTLHTTFTDLPDVPVSKLQIDFDSGKHGLFELKRGLCRKGKAKKLHAKVLSEGQNGARVRALVAVVARAGC